MDIIADLHLSTPPLLSSFRSTDDARLHSKPVYVHCRAGKSRSVTLILAYLIKTHRWPLKKAYDFVLDKRKGISPNLGFMAEVCPSLRLLLLSNLSDWLTSRSIIFVSAWCS
jgi:protein-tyrosine phosphatase